MPVRTSAESQGRLGFAAWRPSSAQGGERRADEVSAQTTIAASSIPGLAPANGMTRNATPEMAVTPRIQPPRRAMPERTLSTQKPVATSVTAKITWSATRIQGTQWRSMPACAASCGR